MMLKKKMGKHERYLLRLQKKAEKQRKIEQDKLKQRQKDELFMRAAIKKSLLAFKKNEVPVGCVIVKDNEIIVGAYNRRNTDKTALGHAEITAIKRACKKVSDFRLEGCTMYVTMEPCPMCAGAIIQSRIDRVVIGCMNPKSGSAGSLVNLFDIKGYNHHVDVEYKILEDECLSVVQSFFRRLRINK